MVVLLDTNVILNYMTNRDDRFRMESEQIMRLCAVKRIDGYMAFQDFEDCLQDKCATGVHADYLITCNIKDYTQAETKAVTPAEFLLLI